MSNLWIFRTEFGRLLLATFEGVAAVLLVAAIIVALAAGWSAAGPGFVCAGVFVLVPVVIGVTHPALAKIAGWIESGEG